jgi:hypothetical protein
MEYFLLECFEYLARGARPALLLYAGIVCIRWARGRRIAFEPAMVWEFLWAWWLVTLLRATGFSGLEGGWRWSIFSPVRFGFGLYGEGSVRALLIAVLMFAPCGFLTPRALKGARWDLLRTVALGVLISFFVAMLRLPSGGSVELGSLIISAMGTAAGYMANSLLDIFERLSKGAFAR